MKTARWSWRYQGEANAYLMLSVFWIAVILAGWTGFISWLEANGMSGLTSTQETLVGLVFIALTMFTIFLGNMVYTLSRGLLWRAINSRGKVSFKTTLKGCQQTPEALIEALSSALVEIGPEVQMPASESFIQNGRRFGEINLRLGSESRKNVLDEELASIRYGIAQISEKSDNEKLPEIIVRAVELHGLTAEVMLMDRLAVVWAI